MADIDPAIEWLETDWKLRHPYLLSRRDGNHVRPIFEVLYDHHRPGNCYACAGAGELIVIEPVGEPQVLPDRPEDREE